MIRLTKLGFLKQVRVKRDQPHWSSDEEEGGLGQDHQRRLGRDWRRRRRQGRGEEPAPEPKRRAKKAAEPGQAQREADAPRRGSKRAQIIALMQGMAGATLNDMVEATGWLRHHPRRADGPASQGLCHRQEQERQSRDGVPDRRCRRGHVEHRRTGARVIARINGQADARDLVTHSLRLRRPRLGREICSRFPPPPPPIC